MDLLGNVKLLVGNTAVVTALPFLEASRFLETDHRRESISLRRKSQIDLGYLLLTSIGKSSFTNIGACPTEDASASSVLLSALIGFMYQLTRRLRSHISLMSSRQETLLMRMRPGKQVSYCQLSDEKRILEALKVLSEDLLEPHMSSICSDRRGTRVTKYHFTTPLSISFQFSTTIKTLREIRHRLSRASGALIGRSGTSTSTDREQP
jgi:hypothetical protein